MSDERPKGDDVDLITSLRMRESAAQRELGELKTDMQRWAAFNRIAIKAKVLQVIGNQRAAFISDEAFDQVRGEIEAALSND